MGDWLFYLIASLMFVALAVVGALLLRNLDNNDGPE